MKRGTGTGLIVGGLTACLTVMVDRAIASPIVAGCTVQEYVTGIPDPMMLSFDSAGVLYVGRQNTEALPNPSFPFRIAPGGGSFTPFGISGFRDPDAILVDTTGAISGTPGSVLVGGGEPDGLGGEGGRLAAVLPNQNVIPIFGPSYAPSWTNPNDLIFDSAGRLLFTDPRIGEVYVSTGGDPTRLFSDTAIPFNIAVDQFDRIYTGDLDGGIRVWNPDGTLANGSFASGLFNGTNTQGTQAGVPMAFGPGGSWGHDLYAIGNGSLYRFDTVGNSTVMGTGFTGYPADLAFGPDGSLYLSIQTEDRILQITPIPEPACGMLVATVIAVINRRQRYAH
ncbi:MAG: hypothetical protein HZA51_12205 [Planctomycetes bacterium]|nr:hypothetical protein [Planctomycetota bacterium]